MHPFLPTHIYVDKKVEELTVTKRILKHFPQVPTELIDDPDILKKPISMTDAKKKLLLTRYHGKVVKACQGMGGYVCCNYLTMALVSNCHLECSYCILQDYLKNNPVISIFTNLDEILSEVEIFLQKNPNQSFRVGTGELSDSLALDGITQFTQELVPFAARQKNMILELKTKTDQIQNLLHLDHQKKTILSWSVNPPAYSAWEEHKCTPVPERLKAARTVADKGYPVAFHLDPLMALDDWEQEYKNLLSDLRNQFQPNEIAWISMGSLRFTPGLKETMMDRWPKSRLLYQELYPSPDGKMRYLRGIREELYSYVKALVEEYLPKTPHYLCMETKTVWNKVYGEVPATNEILEKRIHNMP